MQPRELNVGIVGLGTAASMVSRGLSLMPNVNLVAGADTNPRALEQFRESYEAKTRQILESGELGRLRAITAWASTDWMLRTRRPDELDLATGGGVVYRQAPHQVDSSRLPAGGRVRSVYAKTGQWMPPRDTVPGFYSAGLEFEDGTPATLIYSAYGYFMASELFEPNVAGLAAPGVASRLRSRQEIIAGARDDVAAKGNRSSWAQRAAPDGGGGDGSGRSQYLQDVGVMVVSGDRGEMRQSPRGLHVYSDAGNREEVIQEIRGNYIPEIDELAAALFEEQPVLHSGEWGMATLEVCLAIMQSAREHREIQLERQVGVPAGV